MRKLLLMASALLVAIIAVGARQRPRAIDMVVSVEPAEVVSPVTPDNPVQVCVSGFLEGNHVAVRIPYIGSPDVNSGISVNFDIDATGEACKTAPNVALGNMVLEPGVYTVISSFAVTNKDDTFPGPSTTLTVLP